MSPSKITVLALGGTLWLAAIGIGFGALQRYGATAGGARRPSTNVGDVVAEHRRPGRALVIMAVHPRCSCTDHGHGFGLHSCVLAARDMGGRLVNFNSGSRRKATKAAI